MNEPLVSIVVPVYNTEKYLEKCVSSIQNQTYANLQIVLVDDGSKDQSGEICDQLAGQNNNITVIHQKNQGSGAARNTGIDQAGGKYLAFVDSDDTICPGFIETLVHAMENGSYDLACANILFVESGKNEELPDCNQEYRIVSGSDYLTSMLGMSEHCSVDNKLYILETVRQKKIRFQTEHRFWEDMKFNLNYLYDSDRDVIVFDHLYYYATVRNDSQTREKELETNEELLESTRYLLEKVSELYDGHHVNTVNAQRLYANRLLDFYYCGGCLHAKDRGETAKEIYNTIQPFLQALPEARLPEAKMLKNPTTASFFYQYRKGKKQAIQGLVSVKKRIQHMK